MEGFLTFQFHSFWDFCALKDEFRKFHRIRILETHGLAKNSLFEGLSKIGHFKKYFLCFLYKSKIRRNAFFFQKISFQGHKAVIPEVYKRMLNEKSHHGFN